VGQANDQPHQPTGGDRLVEEPAAQVLRELAQRWDLPGVADLVHVVALDGPAGTGKSSVARGVAQALGWRFVDTGATYRAVTLAVIEAGVDPEDPEAVLDVVARCRVHLITDPRAPGVILDGRDVSREIRGPDVTAAVSAVSGVPAVRQLLIALQRHATGPLGAVVEGRDISTVVAPLAEVKVYLDARPEVRAARRAAELSMPAAVSAHATVPVASEELTQAVTQALAHRDARDNQTNVLAASDGAVHLDTSDLSLDQVIRAVVALVDTAEQQAGPQDADR
jgi:cytidylate kinase